MSDATELAAEVETLKARAQYLWKRYISDGSIWRADVLATLTVEQSDAVAATICPYCAARLTEVFHGDGRIAHHVGPQSFQCHAGDFREKASRARMSREKDASETAATHAPL